MIDAIHNFDPYWDEILDLVAYLIAEEILKKKEEKRND